jgi:hypothetical protein
MVAIDPGRAPVVLVDAAAVLVAGIVAAGGGAEMGPAVPDSHDAPNTATGAARASPAMIKLIRFDMLPSSAYRPASDGVPGSVDP